ncbi:MAG: precorrin-3B C(17)-methyltransferase, partial [Actinomycetota bacterium]|nr:precorrin-3B C(17)-methyltransferase [Actinomycetota bacterium]
VRSFTAAQLASVQVPNPSEVVAAEVGTASVAEAAALLAAGPGADLVVTKRKGGTATVAVARRKGPVGSVRVVGLGPGGVEHRTPAATAAVRHADVLMGYTGYVTQCRDLVGPSTEVVDSSIGAEVDRCDEALRRAAAGQQVALVCSGDAGIFAMATLVLERAPAFGGPPVEVVPGVTASVAAAAVLGAPLAHDHALISLSDLLTPWPVIAARVTAAAESDLVIALYNPRSATRTEPFAAAMAILAHHRPASTPVGIVTNATRTDQHAERTTLGELDPAMVGMFTMVIIGSTTTRVIDDRMVTPRGYQP